MKKRIGLLIVTLFSLFVNVNKVDAVVMWAQCLKEGEGFERHGSDNNAYFIINSKSNTQVRHMFYNSNNVISGKPNNHIKGDIIYYQATSGAVSGDLCWYNKYFGGDLRNWYGIEECDRGNRIGVENLYTGKCPVGLVNGGGWERIASLKVMYGIEDSLNTAELNQNIFVIYGIKRKNNDKVYMMMESYDASLNGRYSWGTTYNGDWEKFQEYMGIGNVKMGREEYVAFGSPIGGSGSNYKRVDEFVNWSAITQVIRVANVGNQYFELLKTPESWMINAVPIKEREFELVETDTVKNADGTSDERSLIFKSNDENGNFRRYVEDWYIENDDKLSEQLQYISKIENDERYKEIFDVARKIKESKNNPYIFDEVDLSTFYNDLMAVFNDLQKLVSFNKAAAYNTYNKKCEIAGSSSDKNAIGTSMLQKFTCDYFNVSDLGQLSHGVNKERLSNYLLSTLNVVLNRFLESEIGPMQIEEKIVEYIDLLRLVTAYLESYDIIDNDELNNTISGLESMGELYGMQFVYECSDLISEPLRKKIEYYMDLVKIIIPIILIGFGVIDFTKAIFSDNDDAMKKAQTDFIKRIAIAIVFFFIPVIVNIILLTANKVWYFIDPTSGSCIEEK